MTDLLNFREFYQKTPILINTKDWEAIQMDDRLSQMFEHCTHWLIGLEGSELEQKTTQWRVIIFPSRSSGTFNFTRPFYRSSFFHSFNEALLFSRRLELLAKNDELFSIYQA
ncbi:hypothetical protein ACE38V_05935 [Cytobacillus sp. Hz8]|uniref:hypothetical protein n=1 Tax=Cytobacillus sp. Hz8 TaxID=3347168 RepID=UPI0035D8378E